MAKSNVEKVQESQFRRKTSIVNMLHEKGFNDGEIRNNSVLKKLVSGAGISDSDWKLLVKMMRERNNDPDSLFTDCYFLKEFIKGEVCKEEVNDNAEGSKDG